MRTLDANLTTAQQAKSLDVAIKITLTLGADEVVLEENRLKKLNHIEEPYRINAKEVELDNSDGYFTDIDLKGWQAVISWGLITKAGKKYSDTAPMWVTWQQLNSVPGKLTCLLTMLGIPDLMDEDEASESYIPAEADTKTVKTLINEIAEATLACYSHCTAYEVVWESGYDTLADTYKPRDGFRIYTGGSRLAAIKRLMEYTGNVIRYGTDGKIHILQPTISGESYDYQYSLASGHAFFSKAYRKTLVLPNYIVVRSQPDDEPQYSGYASDAESYALLPKRKYIAVRLQSNDEATSIAEAILARYQLNAEVGAAEVPINCGAELFDYVKVTDEREKDYRIGNIGSITRTYNAEKRIWNMRFTFGDPPVVQHIKELYQDIKKAAEKDGASFERLYAKHGYIEDLWIDQIRAVWLDPDSNIDLSKIGDTLDSLPDGESYARVLSMHLDHGILQLDEHIFYANNYDPTAKFDPSHDSLDDIPEGVFYRRTKKAALTANGLVILDNVVVGTYGLVRNTDISAGHILLSKAVKDGEWYNESGVEIDATHGINIYGKDNAFTTRASKYGAIQCYVGSDGKIYAGGGAVILGASGIEIRDQVLKFTYYGSHAGYIYTSNTGNLCLVPAAGYKVAPLGDLWAQDIEPQAHELYMCGYINKAWWQVVARYLYSSDGAVHEYQEQDDIALLQAIKGKMGNEGRRIIDAKTLPPELVIQNKKGQKYINIAGLTGFNIGVAKALLHRIEALEVKVGGA